MGLRDAERPGEASTLSDRSLADSQAQMGYGTTRPLERVMASCGLLTSAELEFVAADDVPNAGGQTSGPGSATERAKSRCEYLWRGNAYNAESLGFILTVNFTFAQH
jgi:hypothetical protein